MKNPVKAILDSSNGKFITVTFVKKNGDVRVINGRSGVTAHLKGGVKTVSADDFFTIYENNVGYRNINYKTVSEIKMDGKTYTIENSY